jgi:hypothetical protein
MADARTYSLNAISGDFADYYFECDKLGLTKAQKITGTQIIAALVASGFLKNIVEDTTPQLGGILDANSKTINFSKGDDVASTSNLVVGNDGNAFKITGTSSILRLADTGFTEGAYIFLYFEDVCTIYNNYGTSGSNRNILLQKSANYTTKANDIICLLYIDGQWVEIGNTSITGNLPTTVTGYDIDLAGTTETITFDTAFVDTDYGLNVYCYDTLGNEVAKKITARIAAGFDIKPAKACKMDYTAFK